MYTIQLCHYVTAEDATLSRHSGIDIEQLSLQNRLSTNHSGEVSICKLDLYIIFQSMLFFLSFEVACLSSL